MKLTKKQEAEVTKVYNTWLNSYLNGDVKTYDSYLDKDYHFIGSTDNEDFLTRKETTKFFKTTADQLAGKCQIKKNIRIIEKFDDLIFITERFDANFLIEKKWVYYGKFRFSSVMHKKAEGWRFIYQHFSLPDSKAQDGETLGAEQVSKENQELRDAIKRRTAELEIKNKELEIETSLEKVRAVAMGMHKPDDMLGVCKTMYNELKSLGFDELRNAMIHSFPEDNVFFINYDYSPSTKGQIAQIPSKGNAAIERFIKAIRKSANAFHHLVVKGKELKDWIAFRKANKEPNDPKLNKIDSLHYYNYSVGNSGIGISTYSPISKEKQELLQRFRNVFQLAYQRYTDIEKAEAQAKEAQIEATLERIRSRAMGMKATSEIGSLIYHLYTEMTKLDARLDRCFIMIVNPDNLGITWWLAGKEGLLNENGFFIQHNQHPSHLLYLNTWKKRQKKWQYLFQGKEKKDWDRFGFSKTDLAKLPEPIKKDMVGVNKIYLSGSSDQFGCLVTGSLEPLSEFHQEIISRFATVFNQTYTRFLDLQKAEAQAREAQIEASLERVRSHSLAMHNTSELQDVIHTVHKELLNLNITINGGSFIAINSDIETTLRCWGSGGTADTTEEINIPLYKKPFCTNLINKIKKGPGFFTEAFTQKEKKDFFTFLFNHDPWKKLKAKQKNETLSSPGGYTRSCFVSKHTSIFIINHFGETFSAANNDILQRFGKVFEQSYTRFLDLQKAEAQTKEARIETALERVRAVAMAMKKSDEVINVCEVMYKELQSLGFTNIRNAQIALKNDSRQSYTISVYSDNESVIFGEAHYHSSPIVKDLYQELEQSKDAFYQREFSGKKFNDWRKWREGLSPFADSRETSAASMCFYLYSIGIGHIGISTFNAITEIQIEMLKRFKNVFELCYTRYIDVAKAEVQAREAQIELGLERVRARAMAMQHSDELSLLVDTVFKELANLDFALNWCIINIIDEPSLSNMVWAANPETNKPPESYLMKFEDYPFHHSMMKGYQERKAKHVYILEGKEKKEYDQYLFTKTEWRRVPKKAQAASRAMKRYVASFTFSNFGGLQTVGEEPLSEESLDILHRFGKVFDLTYTRFNDLQKAEAQARESQIETALEKVRSRSLAMHQSDELKDVILEVLKKLQDLGIAMENRATAIFTYEKESKDYYQWVASPEYKTIIGFLTPYIDHPVQNDIWNARQTGTDFFAKSYTVQEKNSLFKYFFEHTVLKSIMPEEDKKKALGFKHYDVAIAFEKNSAVVLVSHSGKQLTENESGILKRFAKVFEQSYTRFLDLQKAEAQAREAQIETALERVRSRTMGMQKSEELKEVIKIVYQQLTHLKIKLDHAGFVVDYTPKGDWHFWIADEQDIPSKITHPYFDSVWANQFNEAKEKGEDLFATHLNFEEKNKFYKELLSYIPGLPEAAKDFYLSCPGLAASTVLFDDVSLYMENFSGIPYTDEENKILMRFGKVFQQTYTRFLDLQKAEAQTREAKIEAALEKVRASAMAMHHSHELDELLTVLFDQFDVLGIQPMTTHMTLIDMENNTFTFRETGKGGRRSFGEQRVAIDSMDIWTDAANKWRNSEPLAINSLHFPPESLPMLWQVFHESFAAMPEGSKITPEDYPDGIYHTAGKQPFGYIGMNQIRKATQEEEQIVVKFASEFGRAYTRFLDLQKAEAQAREAKIEAALEKVRSRTMAMQSSNELQETAAVLFQEFKKLGAENIYQVTIGIYNELERTIDFRVTSWADSGEQENRSFSLDMNEPYLIKPAISAWKSGKKSAVFDLTGEALQGWLNYRNKMSGITVKSSDTDGRRVITAAYFSKGHLTISTPIPPPQETIKTLERFATVFDGTYTRFLDLEKAEAQAREAKIEAALERVRSRTLAMQKSDELAETAAEVFHQLIGLGIDPNRLYIGIVNAVTKDMEMWATDEDGSGVGKKFTFNAGDNESVKKLYDGWVSKEKSVSVDMQGKELENYFRYLQQLHIPISHGLKQKRRVQSVAYFDKGFIGMASPDELSGQNIELLERFAAVFNLTFTRFSDLKIAEAHALQAEQDLIAIKEAKQKAEDALTELQSTQKQLIQSEKMASLGELTAGIAHEIQNPLNFVNNFSEVSKELLDEIKEEIGKGNLEDAMEIMNDVIQNLEKINHHGKRADGIVKGMLQHSRSSSGVKELTDINALCDEYLRLAYHGLRAKDKSFNATMKTDFDASLEKINVMPQDIGRVILNLITNAFYVVNEKKNTPQPPEGGVKYEPTVTITTSSIHPPSGNRSIQIKVTDNGGGIPQKVLDKIFQPFFTTKPTGQGTGLGLSLAFDIVTKGHGGELKVETKEGEGTEFIILLPV